jgi:hypothetical protein
MENKGSVHPSLYQKNNVIATKKAVVFIHQQYANLIFPRYGFAPSIGFVPTMGSSDSKTSILEHNGRKVINVCVFGFLNYYYFNSHT